MIKKKKTVKKKVVKNTKLKTCPCGEKLGLKTRTCHKCNHKFSYTKKIIDGKH